MITRRNFLTRAGAVAGGAAFLGQVASVEADERALPSPAASAHNLSARSENRFSDNEPPAPGQPGLDYTPVVTPDGATLPWRIVGGVKVFHLIAEEVDHEFAPGLKAFCWGYNGRVHGPTIEAVEGDRVRIYVTNKLPAATSVHWHGVILPNGMDGVGGLTQPAIKPGETFKYEFTLRQHSTNMYHSHHDEMTQMAMGLMGMFIIHPRRPRVRPDREFALLLSEWRVDVGTHRPNPNEMTDFNLLTMNARVFPGTDPMVVKKGDLVRIRIGNLSAMDHHPIHLHGHEFKIVGSEASDSDEEMIRHERLEGTVLVPVGQTRAIEFIADNPGDWAMHCHMTHHVMNQMGHKFPNMIGVKPPDDARLREALLPGYMTMGTAGMGEMGDMGMKVPANSLPMVGGHGPFDYITMGGMFNILKVRTSLTSYEDPGWYQHPRGEVAGIAGADELARDGIELG
ncbi:MAG TPA: copper oxidase [Chthoniobacterales bacterium]|nr:copper oxidase [Chthoniobacterales bacterium]